MATACVASSVVGIRDVAYHRQRTQRPLRSGLDDVRRRIEEEAAGICTRTTKRCGSATTGCYPSTPTLRVCIDLLDCFLRFNLFLFSPSTTSFPLQAQKWTSHERQNLTFSSQFRLPPRYTAKLSRWSQSFCYPYSAFLSHMETIHARKTALLTCHNHILPQKV